jgi:hypothetical protein
VKLPPEDKAGQNARAAPALGRRSFLQSLAALSLLACKTTPLQPPPSYALPPLSDDALLSDLERRAFNFFWETTDASTGLVLDRWPTPSFSSIAAVGFGLTAYVLGVERGFITRDQARARVLTTVRTFHDAPMGSAASGVAGYHGFYYHFLDTKTGARYAKCELSSIDTALLLYGMLHCQQFFDGSDVGESAIRSMVDEIDGRVDWPWFQARPPAVATGWSPEEGFFPYDWKGYNEASLLYLLALGSPARPVGPESWTAWTSTYETSSVSGWVTEWGQTYLRFPPLFGHQFTQCWVDQRGVQDAYMKGKGIDYFENSRRATYAQRGYAVANPQGWAGYGSNQWGITACDGPGDFVRVYNGYARSFMGYAGRGEGGPGTYDDGTIAPYAAGASIAFAPEIVLPALSAMYAQYGQAIYGQYGFRAFNQSFGATDTAPREGRLAPGLGWVDTDYLGIELGPLLAMIGNYRGGLVWKRLQQHPVIRRGLVRAGFTGGWLG